MKSRIDTRKILGWAFILFAALNAVAIGDKLASGNSEIGSPAYLVVVVLMFFGGLTWVLKSRKNRKTIDNQ